jgi:hypothetical protein
MHPFVAPTMSRSGVLRLAVAAVLLALAPAAFADLVIVRDGQPAATLVGPADPGRARDITEAHAVQLLNEWIEKITGTALPVADQAPADGVAIYVGRSAIAAGLSLDDIASPSREGVRIRTEGNRIYIAGQSDQATLRAVGRFLEQLGCRYFMDSPIGEVYPSMKTLSVPAMNITEQPGLRMRRVWGSSWGGLGSEIWRVWNGGGGESFNTGHAWGGLVPSTTWFDQHPEWFAMNASGQRYNGEWLCTTDPGLREFFAQRVIARIEGGDVNPSISPPDGRGHCQCKPCTDLDDPDSIEVRGAVSKSNRYAEFYRAVANRVKEKHPNSILNFYAYSEYTLPPTRGEPLPDNLAAWVTPIAYCWFHGINNPNCESRQAVKGIYDGWSKYVSKFGYRDFNYNYGDCMLPFSKIDVWARDVPWLADKGLIGINIETIASWMVYGPQMYLFQRLAYEPAADPHAILTDYFTMFYGPAAGPYVQAYFMAIDAAVAGLTGEPEVGLRGLQALEPVLTPDMLRRLRTLLDQAAAAAPGYPRSLERIAMTEQGLRNGEQYMQVRAFMNAEDYRAAGDLYLQLIARNEQLVARRQSNKYAVEYPQRFLWRGEDLARKWATAPPNRVLHELPDNWKNHWDKDATGVERGYHLPGFDDSPWETVPSYSVRMTSGGDYNATRDWRFRWFRMPFELPEQRGRTMIYFSTLHPDAAVYINGQMVNGPGDRPAGQWGVSFLMDAGDAVRTGRNVIAIRRPHAWGQLFEHAALVIEAPR